MSNEEALCDKAKVFFFLFIFLLAIFKGNHPFRFGEISLALLAFSIVKIYFWEELWKLFYLWDEGHTEEKHDIHQV